VRRRIPGFGFRSGFDPGWEG